jgi:hypothetical protein
MVSVGSCVIGILREKHVLMSEHLRTVPAIYQIPGNKYNTAKDWFGKEDEEFAFEVFIKAK